MGAIVKLSSSSLKNLIAFAVTTQSYMHNFHLLDLILHAGFFRIKIQFFSNRVINDWNSLPQFIVDSSSVNEFKMLLDRHYSNYLFDYV